MLDNLVNKKYLRLEKPKDLIPKDTMSLLVQELMKASSAKFIKNKNLQKNINYMPFVYDRFNIDSSRFKRSNFYYMSTIDDYIKIYDDAKKQLEEQKTFYDLLKKEQDSLQSCILHLLRATLGMTSKTAELSSDSY